MIKLLTYQIDNSKVTLYFQNNEKVEIYKFGLTEYVVTTDGITKAAVKEIKDKLHKEGFDIDLSEFVGKEFLTYFENKLAQ